MFVGFLVSGIALPLELPWLSGAVVRLGLEKGVPTPTHEFVVTVLQPFVPGGSPAML